MTHTERDSLGYLYRAVRDLLDATTEAICNIHGEHPHDESELPEHLRDAVRMVDTANEIIAFEGYLHGVHREAFYSTGQPVATTYLYRQAEPQDDGTSRIVMAEAQAHHYIDGGRFHPLHRKQDAA
ncbi:hypothetical protein MHT86_08450 [Corynebacterium mastitidis]|uniref:hypothetical protein n=1 Tax=Corynebacterium mastitidis TaxID=161890 RepID=UPI001F136577|nr:hypothetical protein [Corynebacterium mastitidis]MCH6197524.1 hypothetical protein [Corynebacterium mastitidis]